MSTATEILDVLPNPISNALYTRFGTDELRNGIHIPHSTGYHPDVKVPNVTALQETVSDDDDVTIVGGGYGVTTVHAARLTTTSVTVYEAGAELATRLEDVVDANNTRAPVTIEHAVVGTAYDVLGVVGDADHVHPSDLNPCEVLELDCEGAELDIIPHLDEYPATIIVETHPEYGCPTADVEAALVNRGYEIVSKRPDKLRGDVLTANKR